MKYKDYIPAHAPHQLWNSREDGSLKISSINKAPSVTQQQFKEECDINNIMKSYVETGTINHKNPRAAIFGDFSDVKDFKESLELVQYAQQLFEQLPAKVRSRFNNNPAELVEFCNHQSNLEEAISLGLATPKALPTNDDDSTTTINKEPISKSNKPPKSPSSSSNTTPE